MTDLAVLRTLLAARSFRRGDFLLASGARSRVYFNLKTTMLHPQGAALCGRALVEVIAPLKADYVCGLEMGAVPLLGTIAAYSHDAGTPIGAIFVRKAPKTHGAALTVEGLDEAGGETLSGKRVVLIDDVATSGGSIVKALEPVRAAGGIVTDAVVLLDREQGAKEMLAGIGITLHALATATDLGVTEADRAPL
jgi:orotate phosphoribosyltransferase